MTTLLVKHVRRSCSESAQSIVAGTCAPTTERDTGLRPTPRCLNVRSDRAHELCQLGTRLRHVGVCGQRKGESSDLQKVDNLLRPSGRDVARRKTAVGVVETDRA